MGGRTNSSPWVLSLLPYTRGLGVLNVHEVVSYLPQQSGGEQVLGGSVRGLIQSHLQPDPDGVLHEVFVDLSHNMIFLPVADSFWIGSRRLPSRFCRRAGEYVSDGAMESLGEALRHLEKDHPNLELHLPMQGTFYNFWSDLYPDLRWPIDNIQLVMTNSDVLTWLNSIRDSQIWAEVPGKYSRAVRRVAYRCLLPTTVATLGTNPPLAALHWAQQTLGDRAGRGLRRLLDMSDDRYSESCRRMRAQRPPMAAPDEAELDEEWWDYVDDPDSEPESDGRGQIIDDTLFSSIMNTTNVGSDGSVWNLGDLRGDLRVRSGPPVEVPVQPEEQVEVFIQDEVMSEPENSTIATVEVSREQYNRILNRTRGNNQRFLDEIRRIYDTQVAGRRPNR